VLLFQRYKEQGMRGRKLNTMLLLPVLLAAAGCGTQQPDVSVNAPAGPVVPDTAIEREPTSGTETTTSAVPMRDDSQPIDFDVASLAVELPDGSTPSVFSEGLESPRSFVVSTCDCIVAFDVQPRFADDAPFWKLPMRAVDGRSGEFVIITDRGSDPPTWDVTYVVDGGKYILQLNATTLDVDRALDALAALRDATEVTVK
jgi:hypothetical protein